jgi:hypothetical protein
LNVKQFIWLSSYINKDGKMIETKETIPGLGMADKKSTGPCRECNYGREKKVKISTVFDVHVPKDHLWKSKTKDIQQCPKCGIPSELFENEELFQQHIQRHVPSPQLNEEYYPDDNLEAIELADILSTRYMVRITGKLFKFNNSNHSYLILKHHILLYFFR